MKKAIFMGSVLVLSVALHFIFGMFFSFPDWFGYAEHFFIGGMMTAWAVVAFLEWWRGQACFESVIGLCSILGIGWEVFEYWCFQNAANNPDYYGDTIWDFQMNFLGALVVVRTYIKKETIFKARGRP